MHPSSGALVSCGGHGVCISGSGFCDCFLGYEGEACTECADGYTRSGGTTSHPCVRSSGAAVTCFDGFQNGNEEGVDCGGPNCDTGCETIPAVGNVLSPVVIAGITLAAVALVGVAACLGCQVYCRCGCLPCCRTRDPNHQTLRPVQVVPTAAVREWEGTQRNRRASYRVQPALMRKDLMPSSWLL